MKTRLATLTLSFFCCLNDLFIYLIAYSGLSVAPGKSWENSADLSRPARESEIRLFASAVGCSGVLRMKGATEVWKNLISF